MFKPLFSLLQFDCVNCIFQICFSLVFMLLDLFNFRFTMDLKRVKLLKETFSVTISSEEIQLLSNRETMCTFWSNYCNTGFDINHLGNTNTAKIYIGNSTEYGDRVLYECKLQLSNGKIIDKSFWNYSIFTLMPLHEMEEWEQPRTITVSLKVGIYEGDGQEWEWKNILMNAEDFTPVCFATYPHAETMDMLYRSRKFSDVTLICDDKKEIFAHKCLLLGSPFFTALFNNHFGTSNQSVIKVEADYDTMEIIVTYLYSGRVEDSDVVNWPDLYRVAGFYQILPLANHCELQLMSRVTKSMENIKEFLNFAKIFNAKKLRAYLIKLAKRLQQNQKYVAAT